MVRMVGNTRGPQRPGAIPNGCLRQPNGYARLQPAAASRSPILFHATIHAAFFEAFKSEKTESCKALTVRTWGTG